MAYAAELKGLASKKDTLKQTNIVISSTFTVDPLIPGIEFWIDQLYLSADVILTSYNQVFQELLNQHSAFNSNQDGINVILLRINDWLRYVSRTDENETDSVEISKLAIAERQLQSTYNEFIDTLTLYTSKRTCFTLLLLCPVSPSDSHDPLISALIESYENKLEGFVKALSNVNFMKASEYHDIYQAKEFFSPVAEKLGHVPYTTEYYYFLATLIIRRFYALISNPCKVIVLDCDNTLWEGVCGEIGAKQVKIKDSFSTLHKFLLKKSDQGILLCLCSKNTEADVWEVFDKNPAMILTRRHIVDSRINWQPKSENIAAIAKSLNLGIDSFLFVDDNPVECADMRYNQPFVHVLQWPLESQNDKVLEHIWFLDNFDVTREDKERVLSYQANVEREIIRQASDGFSQFIKNLELEVIVDSPRDSEINRISQMTKRTNQFNFTTIRRSTEDIRRLLEDPQWECLIVKVKDRFGDYGIVGVIIFKLLHEIAELDSFILSCRVLGRGVEYEMMNQLALRLNGHNCTTIRITYYKTAKNKPALLFIERLIKQFSLKRSKEKESGFEVTVACIDLIYFRYQPDQKKEETTQRNTKNQNENADQSELVRKKETLILKIATELSTIEDLAIAVERHQWEKKGIKETEKVIIDEDAQQGSRESVTRLVKEIFSKALFQKQEMFDELADLENYFENSIKIVEITEKLKKQFSHIPGTILFEQRNIKSLVDYLLISNPLVKTEKISGVTDDQGSNPKKQVSVRLKKTEAWVQWKDIAIIGINAKYPKARSIRQFWENLQQGISSIQEIPSERENMHRYFSKSNLMEKNTCRWGGFIDDIRRFDAEFFHISPNEAETMDPQQRQFMEVTWGLLEDAGYTPASLGREVGVFVGVISGDYTSYTNVATLYGECDYRNADYYHIPNRISYFFDFSGPSIAIDTACSSSGTAIHLACQSILKKDCVSAIVGGVNLFLHPSRFVQYSQMGIMSNDSVCRPFGAGASGTLMGEGIGAILLKPLEQAIKDRDNIYAVIKSSALNSGGKTNGFTVPNPKAQADLISKALRTADIDPRTITCIEAHGTGTALGDPIEIRGLTTAFEDNYRQHPKETQFCSIGSVKSNIGHLESCAAIAGVMKVVLQMKHKMLVPSLNASITNPIDFSQTPFFVQQSLTAWKRPQLEKNGSLIKYPLRAGISSFGAGGVNSHLILEEYEDKESVDYKN
ncbi:MAG: HAD-IIIC family phosphatase, partial [Desulfobacteraceae bacterium]